CRRRTPPSCPARSSPCSSRDDCSTPSPAEPPIRAGRPVLSARGLPPLLLLPRLPPDLRPGADLRFSSPPLQSLPGRGRWRQGEQPWYGGSIPVHMTCNRGPDQTQTLIRTTHQG